MTRHLRLNLTLLVLLVCAFAVIWFQSHQPKARVVFVSDLHAVVDGKDRDLRWNSHSSSRLKSIFGNEKTRPNYLIWLGDTIDFLPAEWDIAKSWVEWVSHNHPYVKQYAVMGNHDYLYYDYPEIQGTFNRGDRKGYMATEVESFLTHPVKRGDSKLFVKNIEGFVVGREILLIEAPDYDVSNQFHLGVVKQINTKNNSIELVAPLRNSFASKTMAVRQGFTEKRGIAYFLRTFAGTETRDTKNIFYIGNTCFLLMSMDKFFDFDGRTGKTRGIPKEDFLWLEAQLAKHHSTHNLIVVMHELPNSGRALGNLHDPNDTIDFDQNTRDRLMALITRYPIAAWISGHTHPDARSDAVDSPQAQAHFLLAPSLGMHPEGQVLTLELRSGADRLEFQYWSTDKQLFFRKVSVPLKHKVLF